MTEPAELFSDVEVALGFAPGTCLGARPASREHQQSGFVSGGQADRAAKMLHIITRFAVLKELQDPGGIEEHVAGGVDGMCGTDDGVVRLSIGIYQARR